MESVYLHAKGRREKRGRISVTFRGASAFFRLCLMGGVASHSQSGANELKSLSALIIRVGLPLTSQIHMLPRPAPHESFRMFDERTCGTHNHGIITHAWFPLLF
jgi:hypothetical protein